MNITHLIRKGRMDPITETDRHGVTMLVGWQRKGGSRKRGYFTLKKPQVWIDRQKIIDGKALSPGAQIVVDERKRQVSREGYTDEHDDKHANGELAAAAACYAMEPDRRVMVSAVISINTARGLADPDSFSDRAALVPCNWPWEAVWWKPSEDRVRDLAKAGALYLAEASRLKRAGKLEESTQLEGLAMGCAKLIDDLYKVGPVSPGPWMMEPTAGGDN